MWTPQPAMGLRRTQCVLNQTGINLDVDFSSRSIEYAMEVAIREQLSISYVNQNYLEFQTEDRFDLVLISKQILWLSKHFQIR